jgi:hypothetical protein
MDATFHSSVREVRAETLNLNHSNGISDIGQQEIKLLVPYICGFQMVK